MSYPPQGNKADTSGLATAANLASLDAKVALDATVAKAADLATVLSRLSAVRATYLDELAAANMPLVLDNTFAEALEVERHLHNRERWFGKSADQSGNDWAVEAGLTVFRAISGNGDFGADLNDEAKVLGTDDTPAIEGMTKFDLHRIEVQAASNANPFVIRIIYGSGTMGDAEAAGQYTDIMVMEARKGSPVEVIMKRRTCGTDKVWVRVKNGTDNATLDFFVGSHEYET